MEARPIFVHRRLLFRQILLVLNLSFDPSALGQLGDLAVGRGSIPSLRLRILPWGFWFPR